MGKNNIRIGSISPGFVKTEALENSTGPVVAKMIYANAPHLQSRGWVTKVLVCNYKKNLIFHNIILYAYRINFFLV